MTTAFFTTNPTPSQWHAMQEALESSYQSHWHSQLLQPRACSPTRATAPVQLQAVFCMDVRSEAFRRALEQACGDIVTLGFAGSFGLTHDDLHRQLNDQEAARLAAQALRGMSLTRGFAPTVLLVAHGAKTAPHTHLAHLQCGACEGRSGEGHARKLADMLNTPGVRHALAGHGILIPAGTRFAAALHDTDTDRVQVLSAAPLDVRVRSWLARAECVAPRLRGGKPPEWGLAGNASMVIAPRARTSHLDLQGRAFLHDYCREQDGDGQVLARILATALPIACGINQLYNEAVFRQLRQRHTAGGHRTGDALNSSGVLHELVSRLPAPFMPDENNVGQSWAHAPQRLAVWIEAPSTRVDQCLAANPFLRELAKERRLHVITPDGVQRRAPCVATV